MAKFTVCVGINKYTSHSINNLKVCERDSSDVFASLINQPFKFEKTSTLVSTKSGLDYPSKQNILYFIEEMCLKTIEEDVILIFFSGHGFRDNGNQYLIPADAHKSNHDTFISIAELKTLISKSRAYQKLIIIDACYSGEDVTGLKTIIKSIDPDSIAKSFEDVKGVHMIFSCHKDEVSWEDQSGKYSVFTSFLLKALKGERTALDDSKLTVDSLFNYISNSVQRHSRIACSSKMTPVKYSVVTGTFILGDFNEQLKEETLKITTTDIFKPVGTPTYTYINRADYEETLLNALNQMGKQIYLYGPSGSGKTCLYETVLKSIGKQYVMVPCKAYYDSAFNFNYALYSQVIGSFPSIDTSAPFQEIVAQLKHATVDKLAMELVKRDIVLVLDDFHRLPDDVTNSFADTLKTFILAGAKILMVGVKNKADVLINNYPDLNERIDGIEILPLSNTKLRRIIHLGQDVLNIKIDKKLSNAIVNESMGTASLVHELCLGVLNEKNIKVASDKLINIDDLSLLSKACIKIAHKKKTIYEVIYNALCLGRRPQKKFATYRQIMEAIATLSDKQNSTYKEKLYNLIKKNNESPPPRFAFNQALNNIERIQTKFKQVLSYNSLTDVIEIIDPNFKFYLKWLKQKHKRSNNNQ